ncbi:hypothetical protein BGZ52_006482 [Haplosporangium bisporale]|nr:hypothetical protein BGZ52_006482 [Haplosporangium bisporale]KAF9211061.1 hypothetical protein BGZ59_008565 [Podila verticillata]KFH67826.1 hypothetical protein MVEG_06558 [Podila verticillata NRRL 6337]
MAPTPSNLRERIIDVNGVAFTSYSSAAQDTRETVRQANQAAPVLPNPDSPMTTSLASPIPIFAANGQLHNPPIEVNQAHVPSTSQQTQDSSSSEASSSTDVNSTIKSKRASFEQRRIPSPAV